jgi:arylsulfatase A-like enzyme
VVEFVNVKNRPRTLEIRASVDDPNTRARVRVRWGDHEIGEFEITEGAAIPLPADLPLGRIAITLEFSPPDGITIERISVAPCLAPGEVRISSDGIEQSGWSVVEVVRRVQPGARLVAGFEPPQEAESRQRFLITVDRGGGDHRKVFSWRGGEPSTSSGPEPIDAPLGDEPGPVRIRLISSGRGQPARWIEPQIIEDRAPAVPEGSAAIAPPPRLVVLYVMDALRGDHVGRIVDGAQLTPHLDHLADEGVSFANHFSVAPNTPPSTRALFSGLCMLDDRQLPSPGPTRLAEVFREAGYRTVSITGNPHLSETLDLGTGFESVEMLQVREDHHPNHSPTINNSAEVLHETALRWIDTLGPDERGFLYVHSMNPHNPYTPRREFADRFAPAGASTIDGRTRTLVAVRDQERDVTPDDVDRLRNLYAAGVAYNDGELGVLLDEIDRRYDPKQVLVALTSDHGEELFEHNGVLHGFSLYDEMLRIPLILQWPGHVPPGTIDALTNTLDLHASLVELAGGSCVDSTESSLWPLVNGLGAPDPKEEITFAAAPGLAGAVMARSSQWKLIHVPRNGLDRGMGKGRGRSWDAEYIFDLVNDPGELHNLAGSDELGVAWLRTRLIAWLATQRALQPVPGDQVMDDETKGQLEALGYIVEP